MAWLDSLSPFHPTLLAAALALTTALAGRHAGPRWLAGLAAGIGVLGGWWFGLGLLTAAPRHLAERLPLLMLVLLLLVPAGAARRWLGWPALLLGAIWCGWWLAGAPRWPPDLLRAAAAIGAVAALALLLAALPRARWTLPVAAAALLAGLHGAALPGPMPMLGLVLLAAIAAAAATGPMPGVTALPAAGGIAALAALPVLARGAPQDWAAAAAPLLALLGARQAGPAGAAVGGVAGATLAWGLRWWLTGL